MTDHLTDAQARQAEEAESAVARLAAAIKRGHLGLSALEAVLHASQHMRLMFFTRDKEAIVYTEGVEWTHISATPEDAVGRDVTDWLTEIGAPDIAPLYARSLDEKRTVAFTYVLYDRPSVNYLVPLTTTSGVLVSHMVDDLVQAHAAISPPGPQS